MADQLHYFTPGDRDAKTSWDKPSTGARMGKAFLRFVGSAILAAMLVVALLGVLAAVGPLLAIVLILSVRGILRAIRGRRGQVVLGYVEQAVRLNLPLPKMLEAAAASETRGVRKRLDDVRDAVEEGASIGAAIAQVPEMPERDVRMVIAAERLGQLPSALRRMAATRRRQNDDRGDRTFIAFYPLMLTVLVVGVGSGVAFMIYPKFEYLLRDFGLPPNPYMRAVSDAIVNGGWVVFALAAVALFVYLVGAFSESLFATRGPGVGESNPLAQIRDVLVWEMPVLGDLAMSRGLADVFHLSADAVESGFTVSRVLADASELKINEMLRRRLGRWSKGLDDGLSISDAARAAKMPALVVGLLGTAIASGGAPGSAADACRFLGHYYDARFSRTLLLLRAATVPATAILFGAITLFIALSVIVPMTQLAERAGDFKAM